MHWHGFELAQLRVMPWKNGGGSTREIICLPMASGLDDFDWRVSIATIAASGPFSVFAGVDRHIMLLEGGGVHLHAPQAGIDQSLDAALQEFAFSGEAELDCRLLGGPSTDFNVMSRRSKLAAHVWPLRQAASLAPAEHGLLLAWRGAWRVQCGAQSRECRAGSGGWWQDAPQGWQVQPLEPGAVLLTVRLRPAPFWPERCDAVVF